jgi:penicillin amidase
VANDMHLGLAVPIVWYVAQLKRSGGPQPGSSLVGVSLPGVPGIVAGSNGRIAWGFTNSYGDYSDVTPVSCDPAAQTYVTDSGLRQFVVKEERIRVRGGSDERLLVRDSPLGVLIATSEDGRTCWLARWLAVERGATNFTLHSLGEAASVEDAVALAADVGMPHQNLVVGDRSGRIAWSLIGRLPASELGPSAARPLVWRAAGTQPSIVDPELGILVTANARPVEGEAEILIGNDEASSGMSYDNGARAGQIRGGLLALDRPAEAEDMLRIQLDDRALFLARWRNLLLGLLDEEALRNQPRRAELRRLVVIGSGRAAVDSAAYRLVRGFRITTQSAVWNMFTAAAGMAPDSVEIPTMFEGALWRLVTEQPPHLLVSRHRDWRGFLLAQVDALIEELRGACGSLDRCVWGQRNAVTLRHPLSPALPFLRWLIDLPQRPLPGDENMPRVQVGAFGASQRFAVAPGFEAQGYLQIAGGQSGHPLSRYYESYYEDWAAGSTTPLLPGRSEHLVTFASATSTRKP